MAEQSSTAVAFRALIILICLILITVAAFWGGSFPAVVKAIQNGRLPSLEDFRGPTGPRSSQATEAPRFRPLSTTDSPQAIDSKAFGFSSPAGCPGPVPQNEMARSPVVTASYNAPINTPPAAEQTLLASFSQDKDVGVGPARRLSPLPPGEGNLIPLDPSPIVGHSDAQAHPSGSAGNSLPSDQFKYVQDRLRQMGATYYVLETCGDEKREFRFYCRMSIGGNPRVTKPFWCFNSDPLKAMTEVLKQIEDWQSGGG